MALDTQDQQLADQLTELAAQVKDTWLADPNVGAILRDELPYHQLGVLLNTKAPRPSNHASRNQQRNPCR